MKTHLVIPSSNSAQGKPQWLQKTLVGTSEFNQTEDELYMQQLQPKVPFNSEFMARPADTAKPGYSRLYFYWLANSVGVSPNCFLKAKEK